MSDKITLLSGLEMIAGSTPVRRRRQSRHCCGARAPSWAKNGGATDLGDGAQPGIDDEGAQPDRRLAPEADPAAAAAAKGRSCSALQPDTILGTVLRSDPANPSNEPLIASFAATRE